MPPKPQPFPCTPRYRRFLTWNSENIAAPTPAGGPLSHGMAPPSTIPSPQGLGYAGLVLQRLVLHGRTSLGAEQVHLLVGDRENPRRLTLAACAGCDPDALGRQFDGPLAAFGRARLPAVTFAPVGAESQPRGYLAAAPRGRREFAARELGLLDELADLAGAALVHHERRELSQADPRPEIEALVQRLARSDGDTWRHSLEVAGIARRVGRRLGLARPDLVEVELGALLHDIGKLRLPARILHKRGALTSAEWSMVRRHPEWGAGIVAGIPGLEPVAVIVELHHERPDGGGYPHGLPAARIPMASRIISVCDAFGAMTTNRSYSAAIDCSAAVAELRREAGAQFDRDVVDALALTLDEPAPAVA